MAYLKADDLSQFKALARAMYFSNDTIDFFTGNATAGQVTAVREMIEHELAVRDDRKVGRLMRKAKFPPVKAPASYDYSTASFP